MPWSFGDVQGKDNKARRDDGRHGDVRPCRVPPAFVRKCIDERDRGFHPKKSKITIFFSPSIPSINDV